MNTIAVDFARTRAEAITAGRLVVLPSPHTFHDGSAIVEFSDASAIYIEPDSGFPGTAVAVIDVAAAREALGAECPRCFGLMPAGADALCPSEKCKAFLAWAAAQPQEDA